MRDSSPEAFEQLRKCAPRTERCPDCQGILRPVFSKSQVYLVCDKCRVIYLWDGKTLTKVHSKEEYGGKAAA